jgi:acetyl esterase/lipase
VLEAFYLESSMKHVLVFSVLLGLAASANGQPPGPTGVRSGPPAGRGGFNVDPVTIPLWEGTAPGALGNADYDKPAITIYRAFPAQRGLGTAVVIAPGGGYGMLATSYEGVQEAYWFNTLGVTAFVLKYRLGPRYHHPIDLQDAQRAIRSVRSRAKEFGVQRDPIGVMGFSAGGHLASTAGTHFDEGKSDASDPIDRVSCRPDFLILAYSVISFDPAITHAGSVKNLLGDNPSPELIHDLSNDLHVTAQTPPAFLFHTSNDNMVPVENSVRFYLALRQAKVPAEMHLFENGAHGAGMGQQDPALAQWPTLLRNGLNTRGLLMAPQ